MKPTEATAFPASLESDRPILVGPSEIVLRGHDNIEDNLVVREGDMLKCGRYYLFRHLGSGEFSNVFLAFDQGERENDDETKSAPVSIVDCEKHLDRFVAVKILRAREACTQSAQREIETLKRLSLPPDSPLLSAGQPMRDDPSGFDEDLLSPSLSIAPPSPPQSPGLSSDVFVDEQSQKLQAFVSAEPTSPFLSGEEPENVITPRIRQKGTDRKQRRLPPWFYQTPKEFMDELTSVSLSQRIGPFRFQPDCGAVSMLDAFSCCDHACLVFPLLGMNLWECSKNVTHLQGLRVAQVRVIARQVVNCLVALHARGMIHTDLKQENVLFTRNDFDLVETDESILERELKVRVIDFGSTEFEPKIKNPVLLQTLYYRAPEVILGKPTVDTKIDMWSVGCFVAELFLGLPLCEGTSPYSVISRAVRRLGLPPIDLIKEWDLSSDIFRFREEDSTEEVESLSSPVLLELKSPTGFVCDLIDDGRWSPTSSPPEVLPPVFAVSSLRDLILQCGGMSGVGMMIPDDASEFAAEPPQLTTDEIEERLGLLNFLEGLLVWDPDQRMSAEEALRHPFLRTVSGQ